MGKANKKDIVVLGIGNFGQICVEKLSEMKRYVLALDIVEKNLSRISHIAKDVAIVDGTDVKGLRALGVDKFDTVIVAIGVNIEIVAALFEIGVKHVIAKATSEKHERVLRQIGVNIVIRPEYEAGKRAAIIATNPSFIKFSESIQEVGDGYAIGTTNIKNKKWVGEKIQDLKIIDMGVSVVSIKREDKVFLPHGGFVIQSNDKITVIGKLQNITKVFESANNFAHTLEIKLKK
ncbi:MAG: TrkA family potassium uptake protein [Mycoplasma sp.]|nr:TrkA family potassium uptake protein [Mycoplasma sp.]